MNEIWKTIEGYPDYMISSMGRVKSLFFNKEKILKLTKSCKGYLKVDLRGIKRKNTLVHKLVAQAFIPNPENKPYIDHINTNKTDNRVENLRWVTAKENSNNPNTVNNCIKSSSKKSIIQFTLDGDFVKKWVSLHSIQNNLKIPHNNISNCCRNKKGHKTAGGYKWGYAADYEQIPFKVFDLEIYRKKVA